MMKIGCKKASEASQVGCQVGNRYRKAFLSLGGPILANLGPQTGACLSWINAPGGMRGAPGDSRFKLSAFLNHILHGRPRGGGRIQTLRAFRWTCFRNSRLRNLKSSYYHIIVSSYYRIFVSSYYSIIVLQFCKYVVLLFHSIIVS